MSERSRIEWTNATWNPVTGCTKVSSGCKNCYAERDWARLSKNAATMYYGRKFTDVKTHHDKMDMPLRWKRPRMVFVNSMSDLFHDAVSQDFIMAVFDTMAMAPRHTFQILTKRPEGMRYVVSRWVDHARSYIDGIPQPLPNVWLGVSVENQRAADERIPPLLQTPAAIRFVSCEPLLGPIDLSAFCGNVDWVIVGGESGPKARPMHPEWVRSIRDQCVKFGTPFFLKQWGEWSPFNTGTYHTGVVAPDGWWSEGEPYGYGRDHQGAITVWRVGKKAAGKLLDGRVWEEMPANSRKGEA